MYVDLVASGAGVQLWHQALRQEIYLGNDTFIAQIQRRISQRQANDVEILKPQRAGPKALGDWLATSPSREEAMRRAYVDGGIHMSEIARELNLSVSRVSRLIASAEEQISKRTVG